MIKRRLSKRAAAELERITGLKGDKAVEALLEQRDLANREANDLAERLYEMQTRVEVAQQDLDRRDRAFLEHIQKLADALGMTYTDVNEQAVYDEIRALRSKGERLDLFHTVAAGNFNPDRELLRRVACALGTAAFDDVKDVLDRLSTLVELPGRLNALERELVKTRAELDEVRDGV